MTALRGKHAIDYVDSVFIINLNLSIIRHWRRNAMSGSGCPKTTNSFSSHVRTTLAGQSSAEWLQYMIAYVASNTLTATGTKTGRNTGRHLFLSFSRAIFFTVLPRKYSVSFVAWPRTAWTRESAPQADFTATYWRWIRWFFVCFFRRH
jgi:hypothetical protein